MAWGTGLGAVLLPPFTGNQREWLRSCVVACDTTYPGLADHYRLVLATMECGGPTFMYKKGHGPYREIFSEELGACWIH